MLAKNLFKVKGTIIQEPVNRIPQISQKLVLKHLNFRSCKDFLTFSAGLEMGTLVIKRLMQAVHFMVQISTAENLHEPV